MTRRLFLQAVIYLPFIGKMVEKQKGALLVKDALMQIDFTHTMILNEV